MIYTRTKLIAVYISNSKFLSVILQDYSITFCTGLYVVSTKMSGFSMEVINSDPNMVICGIRVLLGSQDVAKTPAYVEVNIHIHSRY